MTRGTLTFIFDDGYQCIWNHVLPALNDLKIPAVFSVPIKSTSKEHQSHFPLIPYTRWLTVKKHGHEIAAHSISHTDLSVLSTQELKNNLALPASLLKATTLVYPGGAYNKKIKALARQHYTAARSTNHGLETKTPADSFALHTINFTQKNFSLLKANYYALKAFLLNRWLIETYHIITPEKTNHPYAIPLSTFVSHLKFVSHLPLHFTTIKDYKGIR